MQLFSHESYIDEDIYDNGSYNGKGIWLYSN